MKRITVRRKGKKTRTEAADPTPDVDIAGIDEESPEPVTDTGTPALESEGPATPGNASDASLVELPPPEPEASPEAEPTDNVPDHTDDAVCAAWRERLSTQIEVVGAQLEMVSEKVAGLADYGAALSKQTELNRSLSRRIRELEDREYRENTLLPLLVEFIQAVDVIDLERQNVPAGASAEAYEGRYRSLLDCFDERFTAALARYGLVALPSPTPGTPYDSATQDVVRVEKVRAPMDSVVTGSPRRGYTDGARVHRATGVVVQKTTTKQEEE